MKKKDRFSDIASFTTTEEKLARSCVGFVFVSVRDTSESVSGSIISFVVPLFIQFIQFGRGIVSSVF